MQHSTHAISLTWGRQLALALSFASLLWADVAVVTHAEDVAPSAAPHADTPSARAAYPRSQKITVDERLQRLTESLSLSTEQQTQVRLILERRQAEVERLRLDATPSAVERVHMYRAVDERTVERIKNVLSEEQRQKYSPPRAPAHEASAPGPALVGAPVGQPSP